MTATLQHLPAPIARLCRRFGTRPATALVEALARAGYLARGAVYLSVGAMALLAALGLTPNAKGAIGALEAWASWPAGQALLWLTGLGLYGFAGWRLLQAGLDLDDCGRSAKGLLTRVGQAISGLTYGALAISVFGLLDAMEDLGEADDQAATQSAIRETLQLPMGELLVIGLGLFVLGNAIASLVRAAFDHFGRELEGERRLRAWAGLLARFGYGARGVALLPMGGLLIPAGFHARAAEARGLGGALEALEAGPFGHAILALTGLGLMAFGAYAVAEGLLRGLNVRLPLGR